MNLSLCLANIMSILEGGASTTVFDAVCDGGYWQNLQSENEQAHPFTLKASGVHYFVLPNKLPYSKVSALQDWMLRSFEN